MEEFDFADDEVQQEILSQLSDAFGDDEAQEAWAITDDRYIGFYDVMGFSELLRSTGDKHDDLYSVMRGLHDAGGIAQRMLAQGDEYRQELSRSSTPPGQLKVVQFSDSIVAITADASPASSLLIQLASQVFFLHALSNGVILRGAIARGTVTADFAHSIFFGQPIVDAYRFEEAQRWYGIALHPSAESREPNDASSIREDEIPLVETRFIKMRGEESPQELSVINWPVFADSPESLETLLRPFDGEGSGEPEKLSGYHKQTLEFAIAMWRKYRS